MIVSNPEINPCDLQNSITLSYVNFFLDFLKQAEDSKARDYLADSQNIRLTRSQLLALSARKRNDKITKNQKDFIEGVISINKYL
jgi:hypothetical protein